MKLSSLKEAALVLFSEKVRLSEGRGTLEAVKSTEEALNDIEKAIREIEYSKTGRFQQLIVEVPHV